MRRCVGTCSTKRPPNVWAGDLLLAPEEQRAYVNSYPDVWLQVHPKPGPLYQPKPGVALWLAQGQTRAANMTCIGRVNLGGVPTLEWAHAAYSEQVYQLCVQAFGQARRKS